MVEFLFLTGGAAAGATAAWLLARAHYGALAKGAQETLAVRLAAAESGQDEARKQLTERELRLAELGAQLDRERTQRVQAETRWEGARQNLEEQRALVDEARQRLLESFKAAGADVLQQSAATFLARAREVLDAQLAQRHEAVAGLVKPLEDALRRADEHARELERKREQAYGSLDERLRALAESGRDLQRETGSLAAALRASPARGRWGEIALRRVVELAGLTKHCDFDEQVSVDAEAGRQRPDMVVRLPGAREIVIDAKVPLTAYLEAVNAPTPEGRAEALARHARDLRGHLTQLAQRAYWRQFARSPQFVVMFIPGEAFVAAAVEADPDLLVDGLERRIVIATPTTLFALLAAVEHGWQQQQAAENSERITRLGQELYERMRTLAEHFQAIGAALERGTDAYNRAVGSMERMVLPAARRFRDLGAATGKEIAALEPVEALPRPLTAPEFPGAPAVEGGGPGAAPGEEMP